MTVVEKTGTLTSSGATDSYTFTNMHKGELLKVEIRVSASSAFKMYTLQDDGSSVDEYIIGTATETMTVASATHLNPGTGFVDSKGAAPTTNIFSAFVVSRNQIKIDGSSMADNDTWSVDLTVRD